MKTIHWTLVSILALAASGQSQAQDYSLVQQGAHEKLWGRLVPITNRLGVISFRTKTYCELQTGLSFSNTATGRWEDSSPDFTITKDGYAVALSCQHQLSIAPDLNDPDGVVDVQMPGGQGRLRSAILGLNLFDPASGKSLQIAAANSCVGRQTAPNAITFYDAFKGLRADLRIRNERSGFHQEVLLREKLTRPQLARLGFDPNTVRFEVWTEFLAPPAPAILPAPLSASMGTAAGTTVPAPDMTAQSLDWGAMRMGHGAVYVEAQPARSASVLNQWQHLEGRTFLIEGASFRSLEPVLEPLPVTTIAKLDPKSSSSRLLALRGLPRRLQAAIAGSERSFDSAEEPAVFEDERRCMKSVGNSYALILSVRDLSGRGIHLRWSF
jgi:hypothetical protein